MLESSRKQLPSSIEKLEKPSMKCVPVAKMVGDHWTAAAAAKLIQSCPTLCDPIDGLLSGSPIPGVLQARIYGIVCSSSFLKQVCVMNIFVLLPNSVCLA